MFSSSSSSSKNIPVMHCIFITVPGKKLFEKEIL